jgi:hypothetical protein
MNNPNPMNTEPKVSISSDYLPQDSELRAAWQKSAKLTMTEDEYCNPPPINPEYAVSVTLELSDWAFVYALVMRSFSSPHFSDEGCCPSALIKREVFARFSYSGLDRLQQAHVDLCEKESRHDRKLLKALIEADYCGFHGLLYAAHRVAEDYEEQLAG